jgi:5-methylcytosine-specific restriction endonuclease McrA
MPKKRDHPHSNPRDWYQLQRWRNLAKAQLRREPLCRYCREHGRVEPGRVADHVTPHSGDWNAFLTGELQSLCINCHNSAKQQEEAQGFKREFNRDGYPLDPNHPAYDNAQRAAYKDKLDLFV